MENSLSAREILRWRIFDLAHGLPDRRADIAAGVIAATLVNVQPRRKNGKRKSFGPPDFFPWLAGKAPSTAASRLNDPEAEQALQSKITEHFTALREEFSKRKKPKARADEHSGKPDRDAGA